MVSLARIVSAVCAFALFWFVSRQSVAQLGAFRTLFVYFLMVEFLPLLGMNQFVIREIAKTPDRINDYLLHSFLFSLIVSLGVAGCLAAVSVSGGYSPIVARGLLLLVAAVPATAAVLCLQSVLVAVGRGGEMGAVQAIEAVTRTAAGFVLIVVRPDILWVIAGFVVIRWLVVAAYWRRIRPMTRLHPWRISSGLMKTFFRTTPPFAGILLLFLAIRFAGQMMVPWMAGDEAAGFFAIAYQFLDLILLAPTAFAINLMPLLSRRAVRSLSEMNRTGGQAMKLMAALIVPVTVLIFVHGREIILLIFGPRYAPAVLPVRIAVWSGLTFTLDQILSITLIAAGRQRTDLAALAVGALVTVAAMFVLISRYGVTGAAAGLLVGTSCLFAARYALYHFTLYPFPLPAILWRPLLAGGWMAAVMEFLTVIRAGIMISGPAGVGVYFLMLYLLGYLRPEERARFKQLFTEG